MKQTFIRRTSLVFVTVLTAMAAGCASVAVSNDTIEKKTATALGLAKGSFIISDRVDEGVKASYSVKTNAGKQYSCYVTDTVSFLGRQVSDPVCTEIGKVSKPAPNATKVSGGSCNALLKAAGKC